jgi:hypothetical protein
MLYAVLSSLHKAGVLADCVLIGSWCQDLYRLLWGNPFLRCGGSSNKYGSPGRKSAPSASLIPVALQ